eukprot:gene7977-12442_t
MKILLCLFFICITISFAEYDYKNYKIGDKLETPLTRDELEDLDFEQLESLLWMRNVTCNLCVGTHDDIDQHHMINKILEVQHLPVLTVERPTLKFKPKKVPPPPGSVPTEMKRADPSYDAMMYRFRYEQEEKDRKRQETIRMLKQQGFNVDNLEKEKNDYDKMTDAVKKAVREQYEKKKAEKKEEL